MQRSQHSKEVMNVQHERPQLPLIRSTSFKRYFANTSWLMGHRVLSMIVALFVGIYVARYLGPERFGLLSYAGSFVGLFTALATLGLDGIMVRELVKTPERRDELLGTAFWLKAGGAILMWIGIASAIPFTNNDTQTNITAYLQREIESIDDL